MLNEENPLDHTGLIFEDQPRPDRGYTAFKASGFKNEEHARKWAKAYYESRWGYGPRFNFENSPDGWVIHVTKSTSCD